MEIIWSLIKASKEDMNIFNKSFTNKINKVGSFVKKNLIMLLFVLFVVFVFGMYSYMFAEPMSYTHNTYIMISLMTALTLIISLINAVYKSKGVLFDAKDNDLLLSMPIRKSQIIVSRIIKLLAYQYIWELLVLIPASAVYIYFEGLTLDFLISTIVMLVFMPMIPILLGTFVGYIITAISSKFKRKNIFYVIFSIIAFIGIMLLSFKLTGFIENMTEQSAGIQETLTKIYYPLGLYSESSQNFNLLKLLLFVAINIVPFAIGIVILSLRYFKILSKLSEHHAKSNYALKSIESNSSTKALLKKELKRYFGSTIYLTNTIFGPAMLFIGSIYIIFADISSLGLTEEILEQIKSGILFTLVAAFMFISSTACTSVSSISMEGKSLWVLKSLPVSIKKIFIVKALTNCIVMLPMMYIETTILCMKLELGLLIILLCLLYLTVIMIFVSSVGLLINLLTPKFDADEIFVVKQSKSVFISMFGGMAVAGAYMIIGGEIGKVISPNLFATIFVGLLIFATVAIWRYLITKGKEKFNELI